MTETVAVCDVDRTPTANVRPNVSVKITQCVRLSDGSMISLDMDRGFTTVWHGPGAPSWKRSAEGLILEVLDLVQVDDAENPGAHPWDDLAESARSRGIDVDGPTLRELPYHVLLTDEVISLFKL
ncbi:MAG: hypothetical protein Q4G64_00205 [bacterium]|nr:hypothetical protein [bacterium]